MEIPNRLTCLLRNLYLSQETAIRALHVTDWLTGSKLGKEYNKAVYCHPVYLTYIQSIYIVKYAGLDVLLAIIKIAKRNTNNLRYADDTL